MGEASKDTVYRSDQKRRLPPTAHSGQEHTSQRLREVTGTQDVSGRALYFRSD